ncbi:MAG TPA: hypothetical protein VFV38_08700 [Ktedonobacteraceae bacterium]|nr:hypothetical protein [Ktedonobacteraceae bacterium]
MRIMGDQDTGRLLGAQIVGHWRAEVAKRIDIVVTALFHEMTVDALSDLDLSTLRRSAVPGTRCR